VRLSLANALTDAKIDRPTAERIATEIFDAIQSNVASKADVQAVKADMEAVERDLQQLDAAMKADFQRLEAHVDTQVAALRADLKAEIALLEYRLLTRLGGLIVILSGLLFAALRYLPPLR
jgi:hypothetical protein